MAAPSVLLRAGRHLGSVSIPYSEGRGLLRVFRARQGLPQSMWECGPGLALCKQPTKTIFYVGERLTFPALDYISQKLLRLRSTSGVNPATFFYFSGNLWLPEIGRALGGSLSPGCGDCIWISSLLAAIPRGEKKCGLAQAVQKIRGSSDILFERIWLRTTFPRHPGGYRADPSLACGTLGLRGRGSARYYQLHMVRVCLILYEAAKLSSKLAVPFCILISNE
nr:uncharacterized protein LOC115862566 [Globicephala melas]